VTGGVTVRLARDAELEAAGDLELFPGISLWAYVITI
jgi:hypothetical protein